jgi:hypothetical protein
MNTTTPGINPHVLHAGLAEQGKLHALRGDHAGALRHFREAMRLAVANGAPEVCFRHYMQCTIESLERKGAHGDVLAYCERVREHYRENPPPNELARKDLGATIERQAVVLLRVGRAEDALVCLREATAVTAPSRLPLADVLHRWVASRMHVSAARLDAELVRHGYWSVTPATVRAERAIELPMISAI